MRACNLVVMDAGPLIKLAAANELDLLFSFGLPIFIPDEVYFEATEKYSWEHEKPLTPDKILLRDWVAMHKGKGVTCPETLVGSIAKQRRDTGVYTAGKKNHRKNTGELAAHDFMNNREDYGHAGEPVVLLMDDRPGIEKMKIQNLDAHILTTFAFLVALELEKCVTSAETVWEKIESFLPSPEKILVDESIRGDTSYSLPKPPRPT